ncbi:hypothetical protein EMIT074MI3_20119 [Bacillus licheniformis]
MKALTKTSLAKSAANLQIRRMREAPNSKEDDGAFSIER